MLQEFHRLSLDSTQVLGEIFGAVILFTNLSEQSFKLASSERDSGRNSLRYQPPRIQLQRLMEVL